MTANPARVAVVRTDDRPTGVQKAVDAWGRNPVQGKNVLIKPNFNTADPTPGSTHNHTLAALIDKIRDMGARSVTLGERSFPVTERVMKDKGVYELCRERDVRIINFDDLPESDWVKIDAPDGHWPDGFRVARPILEAECLVYTCCLKTHQYGGVFTMSLKLSVGNVPTTRHGFPYMDQLHSSPHQRKMIAEINAPYQPDLIVLDGVEAFVDGGPMTGRREKADLFLAADDRVAMDAVGVAALKHLGSNDAIMNTPIFEQDQIARAAELELGAGSASEIELVGPDEASRSYASRLREVLDRG